MVKEFKCIESVTTLALGSWPKQGLARLWTKREACESHHMLPRVQKMWGNEPSHSQVNSHCGSWSPKWIPKFSGCNYRGQNPLVWKKIYIIGKILKRRCLKWVPMTHLDIWNTSYDQKKGKKSNWQFDSWLLKVKNWPDFLLCRPHSTYNWKVLDEGYNFASDLITIGSLHVKLWTPKSQESQLWKFQDSQTPTWESQEKMPFGCGLVERHKEYYKEGRWWFLPSLGRGESCESKYAHNLS